MDCDGKGAILIAWLALSNNLLPQAPVRVASGIGCSHHCDEALVFTRTALGLHM
jgi:hypothetical protein